MLLVTGASGLLGANLMCQGLNQGREVAGIYHGHALRFAGAQMFKLDLTDPAATREIVTKLSPKSIVHCAAATNVDWCEDHPGEAERMNARASSVLAQTARELEAAFVYVSTDAVFDGNKSNYSETDEPAPINVYGKSKLSGEHEVLRRYPSALVARVNIYGWNAQDKRCLAEWILHELESGRPVPGFADIHFTPMLVNDLADILLAMLDAGLNGLYHVAGSERISKYEFARRLAVSFGHDPSRVVAANSTEGGLRALRPADISLHSGKIALALGRPMPDVSSGLGRFRTLREMGYPQKLKRLASGTAK
jgi:dTDP-4-dehydrorhamnose reductase